MLAIPILAIVALLLGIVALFPTTEKFPSLAVAIILTAIALYLTHPLR